jgi:hypothetical protein
LRFVQIRSLGLTPRRDATRSLGRPTVALLAALGASLRFISAALEFSGIPRILAKRNILAIFIDPLTADSRARDTAARVALRGAQVSATCARRWRRLTRRLPAKRHDKKGSYK